MTARDTFLVILTTLIWGFNFVVIKWGVQDVSAPMMTALRFGLVALPLVFFVKRPKMPLAIIATYGLLFGCGILGLVNLAIALGTPAGQASLLLQSSAFLTVVAGVTFFSEEMSRQQFIGILLAFAGFTLIASGAVVTNSAWGGCTCSWRACSHVRNRFGHVGVAYGEEKQIVMARSYFKDQKGPFAPPQ